MAAAQLGLRRIWPSRFATTVSFRVSSAVRCMHAERRRGDARQPCKRPSIHGDSANQTVGAIHRTDDFKSNSDLAKVAGVDIAADEHDTTVQRTRTPAESRGRRQNRRRNIESVDIINSPCFPLHTQKKKSRFSIRYQNQTACWSLNSHVVLKCANSRNQHHFLSRLPRYTLPSRRPWLRPSPFGHQCGVVLTPVH